MPHRPIEKGVKMKFDNKKTNHLNFGNIHLQDQNSPIMVEKPDRAVYVLSFPTVIFLKRYPEMNIK